MNDPLTERGILEAVQASVDRSRIERFIEESNRIEGIQRGPTPAEFDAHVALFVLPAITVPDMLRFVQAVAHAPLRDRPGMDVRVGDHFPPRGGPEIERELRSILDTATKGLWSPYSVHCEYERIHPFMDGNGRSGRALWAWMMKRIDRDPFTLPFLHRWYYQSLAESR